MMIERNKQTKGDTMKTKQVAIKNGLGEIKGYVTMYWSKSMQKYVTIPA
jgi:hypothetical protein